MSLNFIKMIGVHHETAILVIKCHLVVTFFIFFFIFVPVAMISVGALVLVVIFTFLIKVMVLTIFWQISCVLNSLLFVMESSLAGITILTDHGHVILITDH